jgi:hypothetical protein
LTGKADHHSTSHLVIKLAKDGEHLQPVPDGTVGFRGMVKPVKQGVRGFEPK